MPPGIISLYTVYDDKLNVMIDNYSHMQSLTTMDHFMLNTPFDFVKEPAEIFKALLESKEQATAIGIKSEMLGKGMFVTGVEDILVGDGHLVLVIGRAAGQAGIGREIGELFGIGPGDQLFHLEHDLGADAVAGQQE